MKIYLRYCTYSSLLLLLIAVVVILSTDERLVTAGFIQHRIFPTQFSHVLFMTVFVFCIFNQILLAATGLAFLFKRHLIWRGVFYLFSVTTFIFVVIKYIGDA